jgi:hypothetical protein
MMAVRASHGLHTPLAPKSGSVRNSLRSDSGRFFIRFRHQRRVALDGDPNCNGNGHFTSHGNGNSHGHGIQQPGLTLRYVCCAAYSGRTE